MIKKLLPHRLTVFAFFLTLLAGCNNSDFDRPATPVTDTPEPPVTTVDNSISGSVIKGPVTGAIVIAYAFDGVTELGRSETAPDGSFTISIGDNAGGILITASGGTYTDEATGAENIQFGSAEMRAAYMVPESLAEPFDVTINITPFTELAVREALVNGAIDAQLLLEANSDFFELGENAINILTTLPTNPLTDSVSEGTIEDLYGLYLAMISQIISDQGLVSWNQAVDLLEVSAEADADLIISAALTALAESNTAAGANISLAAASSALAAIIDAADGGGSSGDGGPLSITVNLVDNASLTSYDVGLRLLDTSNNDEELDFGRLFTGNSSLTFQNVPDGTNYRIEIQFGGSFGDVTCALSNESGTLSGASADNILLTCNSESTSSGGDSGSNSGARPCFAGTAETTTPPGNLGGATGDLTLTFAANGSGLTEGVVQMFTFGTDGSLTVDGHRVAESAYSCSGGSTEVLWYEELMDRVFSVSFTQDGSFNELNLNNGGDGTFLGQFRDENGDFADVTNVDNTTGNGDSSNGGSIGGDSGLSGDFTLTITGSFTTTTAGISLALDLPEVIITNLPAPDPNDDFKTLIEESGFNVTGSVTVTVINNTANRVTFRLQFEGTNEGVAATYDLNYDYRK